MLAFKSSAVPETLGEAAMMFTDKQNLPELAALAKLMVSDRELKARILAAQQRQREAFLPHKVAPRVARIANKLRENVDRSALRNGGRHWPQLLANGEVAEINQILPNLSRGDAISNQALVIRDSLRRLGYRSNIFARYRDPALALECHVFSAERLEASAAVIYHHSIGSDLTPQVVRFRRSKALIYHNITPAEFYESFNPILASMLREGREELQRIAPAFPVSFGVSAFNAAELGANGFPEPGVLPLCVDPARLDLAPDPAVASYLQAGKTNLLFVGRLSPNKKQDDLIRAFRAYQELDPNSRLLLVGGSEPGDAYVAYLDELSTGLGLQDSIVCPGSVSDAELVACYRSAHLFWSMSEHEGFCVPLIEAMWFDVPVLAFASSAIPETLDGAGRMFYEKGNLADAAKQAREIVRDAELRQELVAAQRERRVAFAPGQFEPALEKLAKELRLTASAQLV